MDRSDNVMERMNISTALLLLTGTFPLVKALRANWTTTLRQPLLWALLAWVAWIGVAWSRVFRPEMEETLEAYGALCLTGCAGIAVLGARRPGAAAWNFVVVGLLAVLLLPILNGLGELRLETAQELFLAVMLVVPVLNYLPTRLAPSILLAAAGCAWEMIRLMGWAMSMPTVGLLFLAAAPWTAWATLANRGQIGTEFDRLWLAYRDRFGFFWGQRMREQFNRAAYHAGLPVELHWRGLHPIPDCPAPDSAALLTLLRAVLKRFGPEEDDTSPERREPII
ncbi:MAG TPA: hypothetical protein VE999_19670 [Gemmataceae bacterium]|nr:hypothetical protein [Gemmataceae bacterium]